MSIGAAATTMDENLIISVTLFSSAKPPEIVEAFLNQIPAHRMGDPENDIGAAVAFLAGPDSNWITSRTIFLDGGQGAVR